MMILEINEENESADDGNVNVWKKLPETYCQLSLSINKSEIVGSGLQGYMKQKNIKNYA